VELHTFLLILLLIVSGVLAVNGLVHLFWWILSFVRLKKQGASRHRGEPVLWRDPGDIEQLDFFHGPGGLSGLPRPPFHFLKEHSAGSNPSVSVKDANNRIWRIKWGNEVNTETFCSRFAWACGYFAQPAYFLQEGKIENVQNLQRAQNCLDEECRFQNACFKLDDKSFKKYFEEKSWAWNDNPFVGTRELNGLKLLFLLLSIWDSKDQRDVARGSNTAIFKRKNELHYLIIDWGGGMGKWGNNILTRDRWDCSGFESQNRNFVKVEEDRTLVWGYLGQRTEDIAAGIRVEDVRWFYTYAGRITDAQIRDALLASGATDTEANCFTKALRERLNMLRRICNL
jgi:hypothetical protein